jgi:hypothetical protein
MNFHDLDASAELNKIYSKLENIKKELQGDFNEHTNNLINLQSLREICTFYKEIEETNKLRS